jgi:hypothetical protein
MLETEPTRVLLSMSYHRGIYVGIMSPEYPTDRHYLV